MAKYIGTYATSGDVQTALDNQELSRPFITYTTDNDKVYYGPAADKAEVGDIVVYSVSDDLLHYIKQADYNTTSYPSASYVPVGVVAYPQNDDMFSGPAGEITFMGLNWLSTTNPDSGDIGYYYKPSWGYNNFDIPELTNYETSGASITDMNGKANTEAVLKYATAQTDWRTASAITNNKESGYYPAFECAWRYHTSGTVQGDWYVPAAGQLSYVIGDEDRLNTVNEVLTTLGSKIIEGDVSKSYLTSTENKSNLIWGYGGYPLSYENKNKHASTYTYPFCTKLMTRI